MSNGDSFESLLKKEMEKREKVEVKEEPEDVLDEIKEHLDKQLSEEENTAPFIPIEEDDDDEEDDYDDEDDETEEDLTEPGDPVRKKSYAERVAERKERQLAWKAKKQKEREAKKKERLGKREEQRDKPAKTSRDKEEGKKERKSRREERKELRAEKKEKKKILPPKWSRYKAITMITAFAVFFFVFMYSYLPEGSAEKETTFGIMIILGMTLFLPIGMLIGWGVLDPFMRCRLLRRMTRKNLGVVCFVSKGKRIIAHVKNFDDALIWVKNKCWAIKKNRIFEMDKYGERMGEGEVIEPDEFVTITETVPMLFMDVDNMMPLSLHETDLEEIAPDELGPALKGWVDNQQAKLMFLRRTMETYYLILICAVIASAFFGYQNSQEMEEVKALLETIKNQLASSPPGLILPFI
jgi:hypothetical protein